MKTQEQIEEEIKKIKRHQKLLIEQGRADEAPYWNDIIYYLEWVLC